MIAPFLIVIALHGGGCGTSSVTRDEPMLLGPIQRSQFDDPLYTQFQQRYDSVEIDTDLVGLVKEVSSGIQVDVFFGTWCSDSRRELPRFFKVLDSIGFRADHVRLFGLDRSKRSSDGLTEFYDIEFVPTFIFLREGKEIGRITEKPMASIEADMLSILAREQRE
jgi:thiol-disulfide isomerase/thioredoxin